MYRIKAYPTENSIKSGKTTIFEKRKKIDVKKIQTRLTNI